MNHYKNNKISVKYITLDTKTNTKLYVTITSINSNHNPLLIHL